MTTPLIVLAVLSVFGGLLNLPFGKLHFLHDWLHPVFPDDIAQEIHVAGGTKVGIAAAVTVVALIAMFIGFRLWSERADRRELEPEVLKRAWGIDSLYSFLFGTGGGLVAAESAAVDKAVVDGAVNGIGNVVRMGGGALRKVQTGYVRNYALGIAAGTVLVLGYAIVRISL